jgi:hypothetical protein
MISLHSNRQEMFSVLQLWSCINKQTTPFQFSPAQQYSTEHQLQGISSAGHIMQKLSSYNDLPTLFHSSISSTPHWPGKQTNAAFVQQYVLLGSYMCTNKVNFVQHLNMVPNRLQCKICIFMLQISGGPPVIHGHSNGQNFSKIIKYMDIYLTYIHACKAVRVKIQRLRVQILEKWIPKYIFYLLFCKKISNT